MTESPYVVLIITCNLEKFKARRRLQVNTVKCLKSEGFEVYYLIGNPDDHLLQRFISLINVVEYRKINNKISYKEKYNYF